MKKYLITVFCVMTFILIARCSYRPVDWDDDTNSGAVVSNYFSVELAYPTENLTIYTNEITVSGTSEGYPEIAKILFSADSGVTFGGAEGVADWSTNLTGLSESSNFIRFYALNISNQKSPTNDLMINVIIRPELTIINPAQMMTQSNTSFNVTGVASDNELVEGVFLSLDDVNQFGRVNGETTWNSNLNNLHIGWNQIRVYARDVFFHHSITNTVKILVEGAPEIIIQDPVDYLLTPLADYKVSGIARDDSGISGVYYATNGGAFVVMTTSSNWSVDIDLSQGTNLVEVYAIDDGGAYSPTNSVVIEKLNEKHINNSSVSVNAEFGHSLAMSDDGTVMSVGARLDDGGAGKTYIYVKSEDVWAQKSSLINADGNNDSQFGYSVDMSADGSVVIAGVYENNSPQIFTNAGSGNWELAEILSATNILLGDKFGAAVAISSDGETAAIGAPTYEGENGVVVIFTNSVSGWSESARITNSESETSGKFGWSLGFSDDNSVLAVGSPFENDYQGAVYVFTNDNGEWAQADKLTADTVTGDRFGSALSVSGDGTVIVVGNERHDSMRGCAYIYEESGLDWSLSATLFPDELEENDSFGCDVRISSDGSRIFIGALKKEVDTQVEQGAVYVYRKPESGWANTGVFSRIKAVIGESGEMFGKSIAASGDGFVFGVGAYRDETGGSVYIYE